MPDPDNLNPDGSSPDNSGDEASKERKCRYCKTVKKPNVKWDDPIYCSGKCRKMDGAEPLPVIEPLPGSPASLSEIPKPAVATLADYKSHPNKYRRRLDPETLNWGEVLTREQLKQAGLRANREPIPGDWDYVPEESGKEQEND